MNRFCEQSTSQWSYQAPKQFTWVGSATLHKKYVIRSAVVSDSLVLLGLCNHFKQCLYIVPAGLCRTCRFSLLVFSLCPNKRTVF